jgi:hypothetical protein
MDGKKFAEKYRLKKAILGKGKNKCDNYRRVNIDEHAEVHVCIHRESKEEKAVKIYSKKRIF